MDQPKELLISYLPQLDKLALAQAGASLDANVEHHSIACVNWPDSFPYRPDAQFVIARSDTRLFLHFSVIEKGLRAVNDKDLSPVADDSCVEFFMQVPGSDEYWNFELNCIGALNASHRVTRPSPTRLTAAQLESVERHASCGREPFGEQAGIACWELTVAIPLALIGLDSGNLPPAIRANVQKCSGKSAHRHYVSWSAIDGERPDFHRPDRFGTMWLVPPERKDPVDKTPQGLSSTGKRGRWRRFMSRLTRRGV